MVTTPSSFCCLWSKVFALDKGLQFLPIAMLADVVDVDMRHEAAAVSVQGRISRSWVSRKKSLSPSAPEYR